MSDVWMHSSGLQWLHDYVVNHRESAVHDMIAGVNPERYAELRGFVQAMDVVLAAPEKYLAQMRREAEARNEDAA